MTFAYTRHSDGSCFAILFLRPKRLAQTNSPARLTNLERSLIRPADLPINSIKSETANSSSRSQQRFVAANSPVGSCSLQGCQIERNQALNRPSIAPRHGLACSLPTFHRE